MSELELVAMDEDHLAPEERERLHAARERSTAQVRAGQLVDADTVIAKLLNRR